MKVYAHREKRPFRLGGKDDCWIVDDNGFNTVSLSVGPLDHVIINILNYPSFLRRFGMEVSAVGSLELCPDYMQMDEGL